MNKDLNVRIIAVFTALIVLACSLPLALITMADDFVPENLFCEHISSVKGVIMNHTTKAVSDHNQFNGSGTVFTVMFDGNKSTPADIYGANDWGNYSGALITLDDKYYCGSLKILSGYSALVDTYAVYASDSIDNLYSAENRVGSDIACDGTEKTVQIKKDVKYLALFLTDYNGNGRIFEAELWTASGEEEGFKSENLLKTAVSEATGILFDTTSSAMSYNIKFDENGAIAGATDGNTAAHTDVYGWNETTKVGVLYTLNDTYFAKNAVIYSGFEEYPDHLSVYASDSLDNLFSAEHHYACNVKCMGNGVTPKINARVKYIAFVFESDGGRIKELELWSAEDHSEKPFEPENVLKTTLESSKGILMVVGSGSVSGNERFSDDALTASVDGNTEVHTDVYGALDWETPSYVGAQYTLVASVYVSHAVIYSGFDDYKDTYRVYASESLGSLYDAKNMVGKDIVCGNEGVEVEINKKVKYIAFVCTDYNGNQRVKEFELWSAEDDGEDKPEEDGKKVLTIGNSFSENASSFATEIALSQGFNLTYAYLNYPSCTISQHYENAVNDNAVYKFAYTDNSGEERLKVVKDGSTTFATISEALSFMNWDIVVIQQGSAASYDYASYEKAGALIEFIKDAVPDVEIMIHETWSWYTWATDDNDDNNFKNIEDCYHQLSADNGDITIIPSGRAFEFARKAGLNVNDDDNQHANVLGQYLAGACYVAAVFKTDISENIFGDDHPYFADVDMNLLRSCVMDAVNFDYDPATNWDWTQKEEAGENNNFIARHLDSSAEVLQDVKSGVVAEGNRFSVANPSAVSLAIDGNTENLFEVYGALDWEYPKNVGVMYSLDALYNVDKVIIYAGTKENPVKIDVYASNSMGSLYSSRIKEAAVCTGEVVEIPLSKQIQYVAFIVTGYNEGSSISISEFDLAGSDKPIEIKKITWPSSPKTENILKKAKAIKIVAPSSDYLGTKEFDYGFMDGNNKTDINKLTDGIYDVHYDVWGMSPTDKPGVMYELDGYYDISHIHAFAGAFNSELIVNNGYRVYALDNMADLFKTKSLVISYQNGEDTTNEIGLNTKLNRVKYIAFILTSSSDGGWRIREFEAFGNKSADQTEAVEPKSIIEGIDAEYYGVATDNLADPTYLGASNYVFALTDGSRDAVEFWGGSDVKNSKFVFIYNLYGNYDLSGVDIYAAADVIEEDSKLHKGIKSAKVYASRKFEDLFNTKPIVMKDGYDNEALPDENAYYSAEALSTWKNVKYIAYVFTIGDSRYGACRLEELKAFGEMSAVQDEETEEVKLPQYIDVKAENGVIARIFALNGTDDLSKLDANIKADIDTSEETLNFVNESLADYKAQSVYNIDIVNSSGSNVNLDGRYIRLSIPVKDKQSTLACVDDYGAEIVSTGILNNCITVETETLRSYALVKQVKSAASSMISRSALLWAASVFMSVVALGVIASATVLGIKLFRK